MRFFRIQLNEDTMRCLHCGFLTEFDEPIADHFVRMRKKSRMRPIEVDSEYKSRKWPGKYIAHNEHIIRDDGRGHPHIECDNCHRINVFGTGIVGAIEEEDGAADPDTLVQVLGRSETDLRYLKEIERESGDSNGVGGAADPPEADLHRDVPREEA